MSAMRLTVMVTIVLAASYWANGVPLNTTNSSTCYCRALGHFGDDSELRTYRIVNKTLRTLHSYCRHSDLECDSRPEVTCDACLPHINDALETLLGIIQPLVEVCNDEEKKFFKGEQSLYDLCIAVDCEVKPSAQTVAQYLIGNSEKCDCEEDVLYVPGRCSQYEGVKNVSQLFTALYDSVNTLRILFCRLQVYPPFTNLAEVCGRFPPNGNGDDEQTPPAPN